MQANEQMTLVVNIPGKEVLESSNVSRIIVDTTIGSLGILPHRLDMVAVLKPGILVYADEKNQEHYIAVDEGIVIKAGLAVRISSRQAVVSDDLSALQDQLISLLEDLDEHEVQTRRILAKFEDDFIRLYHEVQREQT